MYKFAKACIHNEIQTSANRLLLVIRDSREIKAAILGRDVPVEPKRVSLGGSVLGQERGFLSHPTIEGIKGNE